MSKSSEDRRSLISALVADGRPLLKLSACALILSGLFAFFLGATGHFLPHDIAFLGMNSDELRSLADEKVANFMIHDRVSFGGALIGIGVLYLWLAEFPLRMGQAWAWWTFALTGVVGFASFLAYLGYGYLDTWHGAATLALLPTFLWGLIRSRSLVKPLLPLSAVFNTRQRIDLRSIYGVGHYILLMTAVSLVAGGAVIMTVGMTVVFVPQDLDYMCIGNASELYSISDRLVPLIAHDRAGFGGGVCCCGLIMLGCVWFSPPMRSLWQALAIMGVAGFGSAIGVHYPIGYTNWFHLLPAYVGATMFVVGMACTYGRMCNQGITKGRSDESTK